MGKMIGQLYVQVERIRLRLEGIENPTPNIKSLIALIKKEQKSFCEEAWNKPIPGSDATVADVFQENILYAFSIVEQAIIFLLYSYHIDNIDDDFLDTVTLISNALERTEITPYNYRKYLSMFDDATIKELLFMNYDFQTSDILTTCIRLISQKDLDSGNYDVVIQYLCALKNHHYSPIFNNYYSIENVYETLAFIIEDGKLALFFTPEDRKNVLLLRELDRIATKEFRDYFREQLMEIETLCTNKKVTLVKAISALIPSLLMKARSQLGSFIETSPSNKPK